MGTEGAMQLVGSCMAERDARVQRHTPWLRQASERRKKEMRGREEKLCFLKGQAAAASLELPDQRLPPKTKTKRTERPLANGPAHYLEPRERLHPMNKSDNSSKETQTFLVLKSVMWIIKCWGSRMPFKSGT